jgi:DNA repair exonuclease SbcCD ATPase subunit
MIKYKTLTVKNFMSVGNQTQAVNFDQENLTLVLGENLDMGGDDSGSRNGTGKTTIVNALSYALYGVALTNIKRDNLINKINSKNMLVTLSFEKDNINYRIERGRKPTILKFFVNDVEQEDLESDESQGDSRETQKDLTKLIDMSHTMFKHVLALNTYTEPFLSMKANDQREIIEQLLGITLLSEKAESLKLLTKDVKDKITQETANIEAIKKANEKIQQSIDSLELKQTAWIKQKENDLEKLGKSIVELEGVDIEQEIESHASLKEYNELKAKRSSLNKQKATLEAALMQAVKTRDKCVKELDSLANKICHACEQELHDHKHEELTAKKNHDVSESQKYLDKVTSDLEMVLKDLNSLVTLEQAPETYYETV